MSAEFKETENGTSLIINGTEITYYFEEEYVSESGKIKIGIVSANDFELNNDEIIELLKLEHTAIPYYFHLYKINFFQLQEAKILINMDGDGIALIVEHELHSWTNPFKYSDFMECYSKLLSDSAFEISSDSLHLSDVSLILNFDDDSNNSMLPFVDEAIEWLTVCYNKTVNILNQQVRGDVFTKLFNFPSEYQNICSQYLSWFGEFLKNLGINASVSTEQTNEQTILIVAPDDNYELLDQIEKLFYQYLQLPYAELLPPQKTLTPQEAYAYQSALMQIQHLQTQIQLKESIIANYQATHSTLIAQVQQHANQPLLLNSLQDESKYKFFGGFLEVNKKLTIGKNGNVTFDLSKLFSLKK